MLSKELARKYYQERIDSESYDDYTEEELRLQKERAKKSIKIAVNLINRQIPFRLSQPHHSHLLHLLNTLWKNLSTLTDA